MKLDRILTLGVAVIALAGACSQPSTTSEEPKQSESPAAEASAAGPKASAPLEGPTGGPERPAVAAVPEPGAAPAVVEPPKPAATPPAPMARPAAFASCAACHDDGPTRRNGIGPTLVGVYGAAAGSNAAGYGYSDALKSSGVRWTESSLDQWLQDPQALVPGTTMAIGGVQGAAQRKAIIDYLKSLER